MPSREAVIIGGGLAGIAAAVRLLKAGIKPTLIERRPFLGGRAFSFTDRETGEEVDNGQHVILGVCHAYLELLEELGQRHQIRLPERLSIPVIGNGRTVWLKGGRFFGMLSAILGYSHVSLNDRFNLVKCGLKMNSMKDIELKSQKLKQTSFEDWLKHNGQSEDVRAKFWNLYIRPVFNASIDSVAAYDALVFTREVLLGPAGYSAVGLPRAGLSSIMGGPAFSYLSDHGVEMMTGKAVSRIGLHDEGFSLVELAGGEQLESKAVISATSPEDFVRQLSPEEASHPFFSSLGEVQTSPIVGVNIWYESPVMTEQFAAVLDDDLQWVFNLSLIREASTDSGHHVAVSLSDAESWMSVSKDQIVSTTLQAMANVFAISQGNGVVKTTVVKSRAATVKISPGSHASRLAPSTPIPGLFLSGDWTDTGLPATMEGAVRSGNAAADAAIEWLGHSEL